MRKSRLVTGRPTTSKDERWRGVSTSNTSTSRPQASRQERALPRRGPSPCGAGRSASTCSLAFNRNPGTSATSVALSQFLLWLICLGTVGVMNQCASPLPVLSLQEFAAAESLAQKGALRIDCTSGRSVSLPHLSGPCPVYFGPGRF